MNTDLQNITHANTPAGPAMYRASTDAAGLCRDIVLATAKQIQGRKFVQVEGWQAIALAHGCAASSGRVERAEDGGFIAIGRVVNLVTGATIAEAEGFVGCDEPVWFGGGLDRRTGRPYPKRPDYAIRAMAQTRAISRACRSAFAHVVVLMNAGLSTTPAEDVPPGGFDEEPAGRGDDAGATAAGAAVVQAIAAAGSEDELAALRPRIASLTGTDRKTAVAAGIERMTALRGSVPSPAPSAAPAPGAE